MEEIIFELTDHQLVSLCRQCVQRKEEPIMINQSIANQDLLVSFKGLTIRIKPDGFVRDNSYYSK